MGFFSKLFKKEEQPVIDARVITEGKVEEVVVVVPTPVIQEAVIEIAPEAVKTPLVELDIDQAAQLETFKATHKKECGMDMYQIVIAHKDGKGDRMFAKCPMCNHGVEIDSDNTPSSRLF